MRITGVRVLPCALRHLCFIEVQTEEGITGIGSTGSPGHVIRAIVEGEPGGLAALLVGEDPLEVRRLWRRMFQGWQAQRGRGGEGESLLIHSPPLGGCRKTTIYLKDEGGRRKAEG